VLSYRHAFHAGNLADVLKHAILVAVLEAAKTKPKPIDYIDTHAGAATYRLADGPRAEQRAGIGALRDAAVHSKPPASVATYLACVERAGRGRYPGSATIAAALLREQDRLALAEMHPADHAALADAMRADPRVSVDAGDGYALLKSRLPPRARRGVVLIDPAYELANEPTRVIDGLRDAFARFRHGVYLVWYPLRGKHHPAALRRRFVKLDPPKTLAIELDPPDTTVPGATASGVWIVNPPFNAVAELTALTAFLGCTVARSGRASCDWLVAED
jgi:23S rRNA (adenine2030-N6)-methyltransferase